MPSGHLIFLSVFVSFVAFAEEADQAQSCNAGSIQAEQKKPLYQGLIKFNNKNASIADVSLKKTNMKLVKQYTYKIIDRIPHAVAAFTQGLLIYNGHLYEGTGIVGQSEIRRLDVKTGALIKSQKTESGIFGEGITISNHQLFQLSWKSGRAQIYDLQTFSKTGEYKYKGEGWGLTLVDDKFLASDGSSEMKWLGYSAHQNNGDNKASNIKVTESGVEIRGINELEYVNGFIYANIWPTDCIAKIDPDTGNVRAWINLSGLYPRKLRRHWAEVLNGIAYHQGENVFYVTGKYWPFIYVIELVPVSVGASLL